ncbi:hypothetical protein BCR41DRAFT_425848 [Lobosporangium transversale]|uniref:FAD-binding domain-containing protein n=1 Tax=Lobosporangium transversale TaxID=64571 RepID=A0A1Y2G8Z3_9FUNG|nr:hypothetical protein BCR41DRAFT_425848 [Lobosporangium transversale]ORZ04545.1 hypothetical protein BCR41DRAFT_425848 [Lobosporangium transversale]|eukprot:XP_021876591.1 hypothetical protein BCR41DRAFT_425848 [Lobosporangium transversale]
MSTEFPPTKSASKPKVLIVGAGIAGLTLAILLEKAGVPYKVYDRMTELKPLGSGMGFGANVGPLFKQIGIYDEFVRLGKRSKSIDYYNEERKLEHSMDFEKCTEMGGSPGYMIPRPVLHDLLFRQVPSNKIFLGKRVLYIKQRLEDGVQIQFSDNTSAEGDILVGADGAHSTIRQNLYESLKSEDQLPASDDGALPFSCIHLVGQTKPLDPTAYPELTDSRTHFVRVVGNNKPFSWGYMTVQGNIFCWSATRYLDNESSKDDGSFQNSEWGPEAAIAMCEEVRDFPLPGGKDNKLTIGDLIDNTQLVSKVKLEEKVFDTWYSGRTVLIGDACHKIHPASGAGATNAIQDAVALANWISVLDSTAVSKITKAFEEYKAERYPVVMKAYENGRALSKVTATDLTAKISRFITRNLPTWLWNIMLKRMVESRPQVSFLPLVKDKGTVPPTYQPSLQKTLEIRKARETAEEKDPLQL